MPMEKEPFWFLDASGNAINDGFTPSCDQGKLDFGNCFRCLDDEVIASKKILIYRKLRAVAKELNEGIPIDWFNKKQKKFFISADPEDKELKLVQNCTTYNNIAGVVYCLSDRFLTACIDTIGREDIMDYIKWN